MTRILITLAALLLLPSCFQSQPVRNFETGQILKVKMGTVEKVSKFVVTRDSAGEGAFAEMASNAATAITPGILANGTTRLASATGSMMDSKIETVAKVRIRVKMHSDQPKKPAEPAAPEGEEKPAPAPDPKEEIVEIIQNDIPGMTFVKGQTVLISTSSTPGNVWPE